MSLAGKRVVVTRAAEEAGELESLLLARDAVPLRLPCVAFEDGPDLADIAEAVRKGPDLVVISSPHAARRFLDLIGRTSTSSTRDEEIFQVPAPSALPTPTSPPTPLRPRVGRREERGLQYAAVGTATAALLPGEVIVPKEGQGAEALLAALAPLVKGKRVLVPRAERGTPALINGLREAGALVEVFTLYRTVTPKSADLSLLDGAEAISFASGSAVRGFVQLAGAAAAAGKTVACIGASTAEEAAQAGIHVDAFGGEGLIGLCDALALALSARKG